MFKSHEQFHSTNGKRLILIADDEMINRELIGHMLADKYEVLYADNGAQTLEIMHQYKDILSLVLLDILMPVKSGLDVLNEVKADEILAQIPIIVMTAEASTEVESLRLGAIDFIPKPYPEADVILARIQRTIELSEERDLINSTEKDNLTEVYNKEFFYRYVQQLDRYHAEKEMDAAVVDVNHFHMINERYGRVYGDEVLKKIGTLLQEVFEEDGGIVGHNKADTFLIYCPHRENYQLVMERVSADLNEGDLSRNRVRLRMGIYSKVNKEEDIEQRFDWAKMAADTVKDSFTNNIGIYDNNLHEQQLYAEQLIEDFPAAIDQNQFQVYYQPKFDVRPDTPVLCSAEALVRWNHPKLGMISPGIFIPLFEDNGLIQQLDTYVWGETARQIRDWKDRLGYSVPVSVNVSRIDMYDPELANTLKNILDNNRLTGEDLSLEVTESAYTEDSKQIIETVEDLRKMGFQVEMDDFGTGYSSLNMISSLPIDAMKLDMQFIRNAFKDGGNTHMLEVIIGIAKFLAVPTIAEGVETEEQLHALKALGCDIVQGYFFSKPVPAYEFEPFILQKKEADIAKKMDASKASEESKEPLNGEERVRNARQNAWKEKGGPEGQAADPDESNGHRKETHTGIQLKTASIFSIVLALIAAAALLIVDLSVTRGYQRMEMASDRYISAQLAATDMETGSDYLTDRVRCFVATGEIQYLKDFFEELEVTKRRDKAVENLEELLGSNDNAALQNLSTALALSNELVDTENLAMRLTLEAGDYNPADIPEVLSAIRLSAQDLALTPEQMKEKALTLVFDNNYMHHKDKIRENVNLCTQALIRSSSQELEQASAQMSLLVSIQTILTIVFLLIVLGIIVVITRMVRMPLTNMVQKMQKQEIIPPTGVEELRYVTRTYNKIMQENKEANEKLAREASHDALTGLFNRGAYDLLMESTDAEHIALILIDVDYFKTVNDTYGHTVGDRVLKRVADILRHSFRSVDILCRIGGDEFAVVMTRVNSSMSQLVINKIKQANDLLQHPKDDLPPVSLSVGVAFSDRKNPKGDIFKDADEALYQVKEAGRKGCKVYE